MFPFALGGEFGGGAAYSNFSYLADGSGNVGITVAGVGHTAGGRISPQANRVCIVGITYPVFSSTTPTVTINGIVATNIIQTSSTAQDGTQFYAGIWIAAVGSTNDVASDGGYDISVTDSSNSGSTLQVSVWNVLMSSIVAHSTSTNFDISGVSGALTLSSVTIPTNGFAILVTPAASGLLSISQGFTIESIAVGSGDLQSASGLSGSVVITYSFVDTIEACIASFAGDGT